MNQSENSEVYSARCREINNEDGVRFAAIINHDGIRIAGGFRDDCSEDCLIARD